MNFENVENAGKKGVEVNLTGSHNYFSLAVYLPSEVNADICYYVECYTCSAQGNFHASLFSMEMILCDFGSKVNLSLSIS